jgi:hypothetical protein
MFIIFLKGIIMAITAVKLKMEDSVGKLSGNDSNVISKLLKGKAILRSDSSNSKPTLLELSDIKPFEFHDYFAIRDYILIDDDTLQISVETSYIEKQLKFEFVAQLYEKNSNKFIGSVELPTLENTHGEIVYQYISVNEFNPKDASLVIKATVTHASKDVSTLYASRDFLVDSTVDIHPVYKHIYPKKEPTTVFFGDSPWGGVSPTSYAHDPNNIVISLYRVPEQSGDSDYVCNYGKEGDQPFLAVPAKGVIGFDKGVDPKGFYSDPETEKYGPYALISPKDGGGKAVTSTKFSSIINGSDFQYEIDTNWGIAIEQPGWLEIFHYDFDLQFWVKYTFGNCEQYFQLTVSNTVLSENRPGHINFQILPLSIMWGCLAKGTRIQTPNGDVLIEDLKIGDFVTTSSNSENVKKSVQIRNVWHGKEDELVKLTITSHENEKILLLTKHHPVFSKGIVLRADTIKVGDVLDIEDGKTAEVIKVETESYNDEVYNFSLEDSSTFFAEGVLVGDMSIQNSEV